MTAKAIPTEQDAIHIVHDTLGKNVKSIQRFPTGLANYVYDVETDKGEKIVVRLGHPDNQNMFEAAIEWHRLLKDKDVPLPELYYTTLDMSKFGFPVMIMERLPGKDLAEVYPTLTANQKHQIADKIIAIQSAAARLPKGKGYGYARSLNDSTLHSRWIDVLEANINRSVERFRRSGVVDKHVVSRVREAIRSHQDYFANVPPLAFLDDTTTKNVIIDSDGILSGIVDVDWVAFGDPLLTLALTSLSLRVRGYDAEYTDYWAKQWRLDDKQQRALKLYIAMFCLDFMSEMGHSFNKGTPILVDPAQVEIHRNILEQNLKD